MIPHWYDVELERLDFLLVYTYQPICIIAKNLYNEFLFNEGANENSRVSPLRRVNMVLWYWSEEILLSYTFGVLGGS